MDTIYFCTDPESGEIYRDEGAVATVCRAIKLAIGGVRETRETTPNFYAQPANYPDLLTKKINFNAACIRLIHGDPVSVSGKYLVGVYRQVRKVGGA